MFFFAVAVYSDVAAVQNDEIDNMMQNNIRRYYRQEDSWQLILTLGPLCTVDFLN